jgi:hypothetical protein
MMLDVSPRMTTADYNVPIFVATSDHFNRTDSESNDIHVIKELIKVQNRVKTESLVPNIRAFIAIFIHKTWWDILVSCFQSGNRWFGCLSWCVVYWASFDKWGSNEIGG